MTGSDVLESARLALADLGLPLPPIPGALAGEVRLGGGGWGTGGPDIGLIFVERWLAALADDPSAEYVRFGTSGYAARSQGVCLNLAHGRVVALVAGPVDEPGEVRAQWDGVRRALEAAEAAGDGPRLLVVDHLLDLPPRWAWMTGDEWVWERPDGDVWDAAVSALRGG